MNKRQRKSGGKKMTLNASIGLRIATLRKEHNMTQEQLAERLDISIKHCSSVERGLSSLSLEKLIDVSDLFDVSLDYLIKGPSASDDSIKHIWANLPQSITSIMTSKNEEEMQLLLEYLQLYSKIRGTKKG
ncbi:MAG: helix-turn-helix transcriptional regulator [Tyzzerella sp.]|nr:helix-turn-helix transcriptional regulator [Tyzzerella sp.]